MAPTTLLPLLILLSISSLASAEPILDSTGKPVQPDVTYFVQSVDDHGKPGLGLTTAHNINGNVCPFDVALITDPTKHNNIPVTFSPAYPNETSVIHTKSDLKIQFAMKITICAQSMAWRIADFDPKVLQYIVTTNGIQGAPGMATVKVWFKIEKFEGQYKFVYCPSVCKSCQVECGDVGIFEHEGIKRLALGSPPLKIMFSKKV